MSEKSSRSVCVEAGEAREGVVVTEKQPVVESRRRGEESQSEALGTTVDGTAAELGGPGERP